MKRLGVDRGDLSAQHRRVRTLPSGLLAAASLLPAILCFLWVRPAAGQDAMSRIRGAGRDGAEEPATPAWRAHYDAGVSAFSSEDFETALASFTLAEEVGGPVGLAYNRALSQDRLGRRDLALEGYRRYLLLVPDAPNRAEVELRIAALSERRSGPAARTPGTLVLVPIDDAPSPVHSSAPVVYSGRPIDAAPPPAGERPGPEWVVSWVFLAVTAAAAGGAAIASSVGESQFNQLRADCAALMGCTEGEIAADPSHTSETAANALWVTTAILGGVSIASFVIEGLVSANPPRRIIIDRGRVELEVGLGALRLRGAF